VEESATPATGGRRLGARAVAIGRGSRGASMEEVGSAEASIEVDRDQLAEAFRLLKRHARPKRTTVTVLSREGEDLVVQSGGVETRARMLGRWEGEARVRGVMLFDAVKGFALERDAKIRVENGRLVFETFSMPCDWERNTAPRVLIPIGASLLDILRLAERFTDEELERNGVLDTVRDARRKRTRLIRAGARELQLLQVSEDDLVALVDQKLRVEE